MSSSPAENIAFMVIRGVIALAIVGVAFYCIGQGIHFFMLPHAEAETIHLKLLGLDLTASGLGAVIFGTGVALCFVARYTAPRKFETKRGGGTGEEDSAPHPVNPDHLVARSTWEESTVALAAPFKDRGKDQL